MNQGRIIVITGAPGTGKTTTASAVAKESDLLLRLQSVCLYRSYRPAARQAAAARWISPRCCSERKIDRRKYDTGLQGHRTPVNSVAVPCSRYSQGNAGRYITRRLPFSGFRRILFSRLIWLPRKP